MASSTMRVVSGSDEGVGASPTGSAAGLSVAAISRREGLELNPPVTSWIEKVRTAAGRGEEAAWASIGREALDDDGDDDDEVSARSAVPETVWPVGMLLLGMLMNEEVVVAVEVEVVVMTVVEVAPAAVVVVVVVVVVVAAIVVVVMVGETTVVVEMVVVVAVDATTVVVVVVRLSKQ